MAKPAAKRARQGSVRIIAGRWRGRRIRIAPGSELRPTPDRVRETLFNWLAPTLPGARCLDLFAGSGALGLEALSRDAGETVFVEHSADAARQIEATLFEFDCLDGTVVQADALEYLRRGSTAFDVVLIDPPFGRIDLADLCTLLANGWLAPDALVYFELSRRDALPELPPGWCIEREQTAGQVRFALARAARTRE